MKQNFFLFICALLCLWTGCLLHKYFSPKDVKYEERIEKIIKTDTVIRTVTIPNIVVYRSIPREIDTSAIIRDYFSAVEYSDTVLQTPDASVMIRETVEQNRIAQREIKLIAVNTTITRTPSNTLYVGASASSAPEIFCLWQHKDWGFGAGYAFVRNNPFISVTRKIKSW